MRTELSLPQDMRAQLRSVLPPEAFLRRDRGEGLFVTNAPGLESIPGFILKRQDALVRILPGEDWIFRAERLFPEPPDHLCATLLRFRGKESDRANLLLFTHAAKLLDAGASAGEAEITACSHVLRNRAAQALRGAAGGGGLYACAVLLAQIATLIKERNGHEDQILRTFLLFPEL